MTTLRTLVIFSIILLGLLSQGCTSPVKHKNTGFLTSYDNLLPSDEFADVLIYSAPAFNKSQLLKTNKIHVEDFELWLQPDQLQLIGSEQLNEIINYFAKRLLQSLSEFYQLVEVADAETLTIRVGSTLEVLKFCAMMFVPIGGSTLGTSLCTPKAFDIDPETSLNIEGSSISTKERISTKNAIKRVAISAKVAIHAGAIAGHSGHFVEPDFSF